MRLIPDTLRRTAFFPGKWAVLPADPAYERDCERALVQQRDGDLARAYDAWQKMVVRWPGRPFIWSNLIACARELRQMDACALHAAEGLRRFPDDIGIHAETAQFEERRGNWAIAGHHWDRAVHGPRGHVMWRQSYVHNLMIQGRLDEAERLLATWQKLDADHRGFLALEAMLATSRGDVDGALALWDAFRKRFPDDPVGWEHYGRASQDKQLAMLDGAPAIEVAAPVAVELVEDEAKRALLLGFESIGSDCEFGLVQRRFGAEPLSLLRFNSVSYGGLVAAIANRFADMGSPDLTRLVTIENGEYFIEDTRWGLGMHTFIFKGQERVESLFPKFCRRVVFLRDKLLADLAEGHKILVYTCAGLAREDLEMLHRALRALGPVTLLHVVLGNTGGAGIGEPGPVRALGDGLYVAFLSRAGRTALGHWDVAFDEWVAVCEAATALRAVSTPTIETA